jgi:2-oxoglutarate ferredoxin oxidoreductase subunit alpha
MMRPRLMKGNEAIAEAAIRAGCRAYFGYPITPQNEVGEYMSRRLPEVGGAYVQAESEVAAINMVYGAAAAGARAMTSTSSPGFSLMTEGISYLVGARLPCLVVNVMRGGPGLGNIAPYQGDYFQVTRAPGHGGAHGIVLAPSTLQEAVDLVVLGFELAERYRLPAIIAADGIIGQMMEPVALPDPIEPPPPPPWATTGAGAGRRVISSIYLEPEDLEKHVLALLEVYGEIAEREQRWEEHMVEDAELLVVAFGTAARIARSAVERARADGIAAGLIRPISLWPFPVRAFARAPRWWLAVELNAGQMVDDIRLAAAAGARVESFGRVGGVIPTPADVARAIRVLATEEVPTA